ncbi:MAG TPA: FAD-dependent oxidoreductase [Terriglobales bacterium]|jgi:NADPH-dependent glutamate synthase beta subunit-like oxidoreductase|nr:FAD-dependent oxidoreductase [Terriglobales bacterium]
MRQTQYQVRLADAEYWREQIKCQHACPVHTDARGYVRAIAAGDYEKAYLIARGPNPLASLCGRICGAPCEAACRRGTIDQPISIRALKRFVCERFGSDARDDAGRGLFPYLKSKNETRQCDDVEELSHLLEFLANAEFPKPTGEPIAVIGSGPAGLAAAHDLALMGFRPTIFEMEPQPAGMLYTGVPGYRLPRELIRAEVAVIQALGVEIRCNTQVGTDVSFADLRRKFAAVIIACGAKRSRALPIPNADAIGVMGGVDFLRDVSLGKQVSLGQRVIVIGGGNVAYDVARTVLRQEEYDVSRTAARMAGVRQVNLVCLESLEEMPADTVEILEGEEEGIARHNSWGPKEILVEERDGQRFVRGVRFVRCSQVYDDNKRFAPQFDESVSTEIEGETVLLSVGQSADLSFIDAQRDGIEMRSPQQIANDPTTGTTSAAGVFVAGDIAYGPRLMIHAIASGKQAARSVYRFVRGNEIAAEEVQFHFPIEHYRREKHYERQSRLHVPTLAPEERLKSPAALVEIGYNEDQARAEAGRCLDCGINTIFDGERCVLCGGCVDVCPTVCLKLVTYDRLELTPELEDAARELNLDPGDLSAIIKDEERCIRCGLCAQRCPTTAITMEQFSFAKEWKPCPA